MASLPSASTKPTSVQLGRIHVLKEGSHPPQNGPVVYWMFRDQRLKDNWALIHAVDQANKANVPVAIAFNLFDQFLGAKARQLGFMLKGLRQLQKSIEHTQIPFFLFRVLEGNWSWLWRTTSNHFGISVINLGSKIPIWLIFRSTIPYGATVMSLKGLMKGGILISESVVKLILLTT